MPIMCAKRMGSTGGTSTSIRLGPTSKKSRFDVDLVLLSLRDEYSKRCACKEDFPLVVVLQHQLYAHLDNRTLVDRRIEELVQSGCLRAVRVGAAEDETALVDFEEYQEHALSMAKNKLLMKKFLGSLKLHWNVVFSREQLNKLDFTEKEISQLIRMGVLSLRKTVGSYFLSIPGASEYVRHLEAGRKALQQALKKTKFKQILRDDFEKKKLARTRLSVSYLIDDALGKDVLEPNETTSGLMLTLTD
ncbi:serine/threonine-protein kinase 19-like [Tropilaelaps mercedesae]|uniref:Serine/threonine-protein kinase 19-like n=1 Tax=Tropilaelaps mercedesae TaxID=418985 RepID=A0A1V9XSJ0_9ACAR|nr:serine/threonine-protein kinase 19-like [Tropilaelaps mercedesae]